MSGLSGSSVLHLGGPCVLLACGLAVCWMLQGTFTSDLGLSSCMFLSQLYFQARRREENVWEWPQSPASTSTKLSFSFLEMGSPGAQAGHKLSYIAKDDLNLLLFLPLFLVQWDYRHAQPTHGRPTWC